MYSTSNFWGSYFTCIAQGTEPSRDIYHLVGHHLNISKKYPYISTKYLQVLLACNTGIIHDFFHAQASSKLEFEQVGLHNQHRLPHTAPNNRSTEERILMSGNELCGAHYHNYFMVFEIL